MRKMKLISCLTLVVAITMISVGMVIYSENTYAKTSLGKIEEFDIRNISTSANNINKEKKEEQPQEEKESVLFKDIKMDISQASMLREEVYEGMTLEEVADQLNKTLKNELAGKGMTIASKSIELGVDPFVATAIMMHETGCGQSTCSKIARTCNNFGGQKGSGCGAYKKYDSIDEGLNGMITNLYKNYYSQGLTTPEAIGPKYAESSTWVGMINWYVGKIKNA